MVLLLQVIGVIVSHVRRQRVTPEGCKYLTRDMKEYSKVRSLPFSIITIAL